MENVDLIVIGSGPGGYEVAAHQAAAGKAVVIIEKDLVGGTCLNRGCIPTKCLCAGASLIERIHNANDFGVTVENVNISYKSAYERSRQVVDNLRAGIDMSLAKCRVVHGEACIQPDKTVRVGDQVFKAPMNIIATGSAPVKLNIPGADLAMTSDDFLRLEKLPESLVIIGGGVIGLEFAFVANAYGVDVTVVEYCKEILPPFDAEVAKRLRLLMTEKGVKFITSASATAIDKSDEDTLTVHYTDKKGEEVIQTRSVLMAVGRKAVLPPGAESAGIELTPKGFIMTNEDFQTSVPEFFAVGDCNGKFMLAHVATAQSMAVIGQDINLNVVPSAVFTHPELAGVGLTTQRCKDLNIPFETKKSLYRANGKATADGCADGFVKLLINPTDNSILGCHIMGAHASDIIQQVAIAMANNLTVQQLCVRTVFGHPTLSEVLKNTCC